MAGEYDVALADIKTTLDGIYDSIYPIKDSYDSYGALTVRFYEGDYSVDRIYDSLSNIEKAIEGLNTGTPLDYSQALAKVSQLLVYTDALLIVLIVFLVLGVGVFVGGKVTDWLKLRQ